MIANVSLRLLDLTVSSASERSRPAGSWRVLDPSE
jgi:hypothetical protein